MLSWICPECGCECPPEEQTCRRCSSATAPQLVTCMVMDSENERRNALPPAREPKLLVSAVPYENGAIAVYSPPVALAKTPVLAWAPAPVSERLIRTRDLRIKPRSPRKQRWMSSIEPQATRPHSPSLPSELQNFPYQKNISADAARRRSAVPGWAVSLFTAFLLLATAGWALVNFGASAETTSETATAAAAPAAAVSAHPFARFIEVTGVRVIVDLNKASRVQFLVVNHSSSELSGLALEVKLRSTETASTPICEFTAHVPALAAYESKEVAVDLPEHLRGVVPDWERLRAETVITPVQ